MYPVIQIGPVAIQSGGFILVLCFYVATLIVTRTAKQLLLDTSVIEKVLFFSLLAGIVGARLGFILQYPSAFTGNWLSVFALNPTLLDPSSGLLFGFICMVVLINRWKVPLLLFLDALSTGAIVMIAGIYFSNFASGSYPGTITQLPWGVNLAGAVRHPVQIYEIVGALLTGIYLWYLLKSHESDRYAGKTFFIFMAASSSIRLLLEIFHQQGDMLIGLRTVQIICFMILIGSFIGLDLVYTRHPVSNTDIMVDVDE